METLTEELEGAQLQSSSEQGNIMQRAQEAVTALQYFNRHYFELHPLDKAARKEEDVKTKLKETLDLLESLQESLPKVQYWCSKGQALNVLPDYCQEAEECLSKAIKHDPTLIEAWNGLGETYWKAGKVQEAYDCFVGSLAHLKNKESLRNLSMVLRQLGKDATEREANIKESVEKAKEAVGLDVKDGISWMVLGNAYMSLFFASNQDSKILKQCFSAYSQAEKDPIARNNPDLHFNKATFYQYEENYEDMLRELSLSSALDPGWSTPNEKKETIVKFVKTMARLIDCKGKAKPKLLSSLASSLALSHKHLGLESEKVLVSCSELKEGTNTGRVFLGGVVCVIQWKERVPYACVLIDSGSNAIGLTLYNLAQSTNFSVGDTIAVPDPVFRSVQVNHNSDVIQYHVIRVDNPRVLLVNGQKLSTDKLAPSTVSITAFS